MAIREVKGKGIGILLLVFGAGAAVGWFADRSILFSRQTAKGHTHREIRLHGYRFINPLLECDMAAEQIGPELAPFKYKVELLIKQRIAAGDAETISVYFRDLANGPWFGINEDALFSPASLMKVPVMMAYLKKAENRPELLETQRFVYDGTQDWNAPENIKPAKAVAVGRSYTVNELIDLMMRYSDNNAWSLLYQHVSTEELDRILNELNMEYDPNRSEDFMSVKSYSTLYRVLYNASYMNRQMSEKALEYLARDDFRDGILSGVPQGVTVASKFGERTLGDHREVKQLHEFGIVYYPQGHYLLGIMTRGHDFTKQKGILRDISRLVYEEVDRQNRVGKN
jgi:beta-lactamase class A